jgi:hypothetical protein
MVKTALPEYHRLMQRTVEELKLPFGERPQRTAEDIERETRHPLNQILLPVFAQASDKEASEVAIMRLVGCTAAIRLHKLRTGKYPASLEALQLGEMIIDPFSGKPFVYTDRPALRVPAVFGEREPRRRRRAIALRRRARIAWRPLARERALARPPEGRAPRATAAGCPYLAAVA